MAGEENAVPALSRAASARQASVDLAAAKEEYLRHWSRLDAAGEDDGTAVPEVVLALWRGGRCGERPTPPIVAIQWSTSTTVSGRRLAEGLSSWAAAGAQKRGRRRGLRGQRGFVGG